MTRPPQLVALLILVAVTATAAPAEAKKLALSTLEGEVVSLRLSQGEGDLELLAVEIRAEDGNGDAVVVLLAPESACEEIGFEGSAGDRLRARVFVQDDGIAKAHKVLNLSQGTMVRFRTLRNVPLWTSTGAWQGGSSRVQPGSANAPRHRRGSGAGSAANRGGPGK